MSDLDNSFRHRLGARLERHVMRSAVDMLDERGTELDSVDRDLKRRERELQERLARAESREEELEHRERRLAELGGDDLDGQPRIDHLIRQLDATEAALGQVRAEARGEIAAAHEELQELRARVRQLEEQEHRHLINQADLTRRESTVSSVERELRDREEALRHKERELEEREDALRGREGGWWTGASPRD